MFDNDISCCIVPTDRVNKLEQQLKQMTEREKRLHDELEEMKVKQQQQPMREGNRRRKESRKSAADESDLNESKKDEQEKVSGKVVAGKMHDEMKSVKEKELKLMDQITEVLQQTAEKADRKQKEFSAEMLQQITNFAHKNSVGSQAVLHQTWQMVEDLDLLTSQPDVGSMTSKEFKKKVVDMVQKKWVPRNNEYVEKGLHELRGEMATQCEAGLRSFMEEISTTIQGNMSKSLKLVDELQNAHTEERKLRDEYNIR